MELKKAATVGTLEYGPAAFEKLTAEREDAVPMAHLFDMDY